MTNPTPLAFVIGHPVSHSLSPEIFGFLSKRHKRALHYSKLDIEEKNLTSVLDTFKKLPVAGCNVTIPYKEKIIPFLSGVSIDARRIRAVNVLHYQDNKIKGFNTDYLGILNCLKERSIKLYHKNVVIFGAGGAARAAAYACGKEGAHNIFILNRTFSKGKVLATQLGYLFPYSSVKAFPFKTSFWRENVALYINCTSMGMEDGATRFPLPRRLSEGAYAMDIVYNRKETPFLKAAKKRGLKTIHGLDMLIWQALGTWDIWFPDKKNTLKIKKDLKTFLGKFIK